MSTLHDKIATSAGIKRARVRCEKCKREQDADGGRCLANGWPYCCGYTMTLLPAAPHGTILILAEAAK